MIGTADIEIHIRPDGTPRDRRVDEHMLYARASCNTAETRDHIELSRSSLVVYFGLLSLFQRDAFELRIPKCKIHVFCSNVVSLFLLEERCQERGRANWCLRRHCVAAPFNKLSIVAQTTTLLPLEWTANPPTSTP